MSQARDFADSFSAVSTGRRNMIINGAMQVAQRGTSATGVSTYGYKTVDRFPFHTAGSPSSVYTITQESDAPDGFEKSLKYDCTTADTSFGSTDQNTAEYRFERSDLQRLQHGTSGAKAITLSFWVKSNVTGDYVVWFYKNETQDRQTNKVYTINSADTWEYKTLTIDGDTDADGAISTGTDYGMILRWVFASGSTYTSGTSPDGSWEDYANANAYAGQAVNLASAIGNTWQITGIQFELGNSASPFEHRSYGEELALCQRYFYKHVDATSQTVGLSAMYNSSVALIEISPPVTMRATPTMSHTSGTNYYTNWRNNASDNFNGFTYWLNASPTGGYLQPEANLSGTAGHGGICVTNNASSSISLSAEL